MGSSYVAPTYVAQPQRSSTDTTTWALVAVVVAVIFAAGGWAIARIGQPSQNDLEFVQGVAYQHARARGRENGYRKGVRQGRRESSLQTKLQMQHAGTKAYDKGYQRGMQTDPSARDGYGSYGADANPYAGDATRYSSPLSYGDPAPLASDTPVYSTGY